jgi:hypothetical protein
LARSNVNSLRCEKVRIGKRKNKMRHICVSIQPVVSVQPWEGTPDIVHHLRRLGYTGSGTRGLGPRALRGPPSGNPP